MIMIGLCQALSFNCLINTSIQLQVDLTHSLNLDGLASLFRRTSTSSFEGTVGRHHVVRNSFDNEDSPHEGGNGLGSGFNISMGGRGLSDGLKQKGKKRKVRQSAFTLLNWQSFLLWTSTASSTS